MKSPHKWPVTQKVFPFDDVIIVLTMQDKGALCLTTKEIRIYLCVVVDEFRMGRFDLVTCASLTHRGRETHICVGNLTIIGSDNGLSPGRRQAIFWTNAGLLLIGSLGTNFSEILIEIHIFSFKKMHLKVSSAKWRPFCFGLNVLIMRLMAGDGRYDFLNFCTHFACELGSGFNMIE